MEEIRFLLIHLGVPLVGVALFLILRRRMLESGMEDPPIKFLFFLFATYGALIVLILTALFWYWSGMASLGLLYLLLVAPILTLGLALALFRYRRSSGYHLLVFWLSVSYVPCLLLLCVVRTFFYRHI